MNYLKIERLLRASIVQVKIYGASSSWYFRSAIICSSLISDSISDDLSHSAMMHILCSNVVIIILLRDENISLSVSTTLKVFL